MKTSLLYPTDVSGLENLTSLSNNPVLQEQLTCVGNFRELMLMLLIKQQQQKEQQ